MFQCADRAAERAHAHSVLLAAAALLALWKLRADVITMIGACGLAGLIYSMIA